MATAVVVGAGIGGLSAAIGLRRRGWDVTVLERAPRIEAVGAGLTLLANGLRALDALGVGAAVRAEGQVEAAGGLRTPDGTWLSRIDSAALTRALGTSALGIHRATLHRVLADALPPGTLVLGAEVSEVVAGAGQPVHGREVIGGAGRPVHGGDAAGGVPAGGGGGRPFHGGEAAGGAGRPVSGGEAVGGVPAGGGGRPVGGGEVVGGARPRVDGREVDLVVAADGINSAVRRRLWPDLPAPAYAGSTAWRGVTTEAWTGAPLVGITWGEGAEFGMVPLGDGRAYWFGAVTSPPGAWHDDELAAVRARFGHWHDPIPALMAASDTVLRDDIYQLATPLPSYVDGGVVLLGDAAHAMTPNLGQGANQALEDAVVLASVCDPAGELGPALAAYDAQRRPRSQAVARAAYQAGRFGQQLRNPVAVTLRNTLIRLTPPRAGLRSMLRYVDWTPPELP